VRECLYITSPFSVFSGCGAESEKKEKLRLALKRVSKPHYNSLKHLIDHLHKVELFHHVNKMTARNLAVVFAPTLIRSPNQTIADQFTDMKRLPEHREIVELLISNKKYFFA
jgi:N-acetyl-gamma-glutamylphosphate reductase